MCLSSQEDVILLAPSDGAMFFGVNWVTTARRSQVN